MKCHFTFKHLDYSETLVEHSIARIHEFTKLLLKEGKAHIEFSRNKKHDYICEITIQSGIGYFKATGHSDSFQNAVEVVCMKLDRQIMKNKNIHQKHKGPERSKRGRHEFYNQVIENSYAENYDLPYGNQGSSKKVA